MSDKVSDTLTDDRPDTSPTTDSPPAPDSGDTLRIPKTLIRKLFWVVVAIAIVAAIVWIIVDARSQLSSARNENTAAAQVTADEQRAEKVAADYAKSASDLDFTKSADWPAKLSVNTTDVLTQRFRQVATDMQQIFVPIKWQSHGSVIDSHVVNQSKGVYTVYTTVNLIQTSSQFTDGRSTITVYKIDVDRNQDWKISNVGVPPGVSDMFAKPDGGR
ncbi:hypothetical protein GOEFS_095_00370 [Gordonia effusa NBRC 100432]|uniref:Mce-associated membrane protein n=1 Tax=Gordonia effusa NBRC 100432 TaxID=1077974 RepID=H0R401_9ACTN|nr:hypothetical protein [Gordonia effusa]GAB19802.1 hypothetical protein GOEFS_095_00370 [Gordonia effusa NBRC 100432]